VGLGEDGPTHQPIEQLASLRAIPGLVDIRPADAAETAEAWRFVMEYDGGPVFLALTRQAVPHLERPGEGVENLRRGAYVLAEAEGGDPRVILMASGSEVALALEGRRALQAEGIPTRVVSMPSWALFERQPRRYRDTVLPPAVTARVAIEAGSPMGWHRWVGSEGRIIGLARFGESAPATTLFENLGFSVNNVVARARQSLGLEPAEDEGPTGGAGPTRFGVDEH
jgi:transketolase